jgi:hypothetical protein
VLENVGDPQVVEGPPAEVEIGIHVHLDRLEAERSTEGHGDCVVVEPERPRTEMREARAHRAADIEH